MAQRAKRTYLNRKRVRSKSGRREDLENRYFRSQMEADVARMFEWFRTRLGLVASWRYEPRTFYFTEHGYKAGPWTYKPDFFVQWTDAKRAGRPPAVVANGGEEWFEVKGKEVSGDRMKARRMKRHYPEFIITVIGASDYRELCERYAGLIPFWEGKASRRRRRRL